MSDALNCEQRGCRTPTAVALWILFCAFCNCAGWLLSASHLLNALGYVICFASAGVAMWIFRRRLFQGGTVYFPRITKRRFLRAVPATFLVLAAVACLGGILHSPSNYDALSYRIPRVLHWLADQRWHWIHTEFERLNARGCGMEWVCAPLLCFFHTDRFLFLLNVISFLLLPGLIFSLFRSLGISSRLSWFWMWVLPGGYCFVLQAGSVGNDLFAAVFVLAAMDFAARARASGRIGDLWLSALSAALFTAVKGNTLPLGLVWVALAIAGLKLLSRNIGASVLVLAGCCLCSFLPTAILNYRHCGDWTGAKAERLEFKAAEPWARLIGNTVIVAIDNLMPPVAPFAPAWNEGMAARLLPPKLQDAVNRNFLPGSAVFALKELQTEEGAGLGFGASWLMLATAVMTAFASRRATVNATTIRRQMQLFFALPVLIATLALLLTSFVQSTSRLLAPYYPLLIALFLLPSRRTPSPKSNLAQAAQSSAIRIRGSMFRRREIWLTSGAVLAAALAALLLAVNPARPLLPVRALLDALNQVPAVRSLSDRAQRVYNVYAHRSRAFAPALAITPADARIVGMVTFDDPEAAMWRPFGSRRIVHVRIDDDAQFLQAEGLKYIWVNVQKFGMLTPVPFESWLGRVKARRLETIELDLRAGEKPQSWCLVELL